MDNYKDKYNNIVSKLLELVAKERELDKVEEEIEINLEKRNVCIEELSKLVGIQYEMKHEVISKKNSKCMGKAILFSLISGLVFVYIGVNFIPSLWIAFIYIVLNIIVHRNMYIKKVNDKEYMLGELESSYEYQNIINKINDKKKERNQFSMEDERLMNKLSQLHSDTMNLIKMIYEFISEDKVQDGIDETLENNVNLENEYNENKGLIRIRKKITKIKNND